MFAGRSTARRSSRPKSIGRRDVFSEDELMTLSISMIRVRGSIPNDHAVDQSLHRAGWLSASEVSG